MVPTLVLFPTPRHGLSLLLVELILERVVSSCQHLAHLTPMLPHRLCKNKGPQTITTVSNGDNKAPHPFKDSEASKILRHLLSCTFLYVVHIFFFRHLLLRFWSIGVPSPCSVGSQSGPLFSQLWSNGATTPSFSVKKSFVYFTERARVQVCLYAIADSHRADDYVSKERNLLEPWNLYIILWTAMG